MKWTLTKKCVDVRYFNSNFFGHGTAADLRREFDEYIKELDPSKMLKISMDGSSMNWKFYEAVTKDMAQKMNYTNLSIIFS